MEKQMRTNCMAIIMFNSIKIGKNNLTGIVGGISIIRTTLCCPSFVSHFETIA